MAETDLEISDGRYALWSQVFNGLNTQWTPAESRIILGNFFIGLQAQGTQLFDAQLPPGSTINSAFMRVTGHSNSFATTVTSILNAPDRGTQVPLDVYRLQPLLQPLDLFTAWRLALWDNLDIDILNPISTVLLQTSGGVNNQDQNVGIISAPSATIPINESAAQTFSLGANANLGFARFQLTRIGNPTGSLRIRLMDTELIGGIPFPNGNILATSTDILASTVPVVQGDVTFVFPVGQQFAMQAGTTYALVFEKDYPADFANWIQVAKQNAFLSTGQASYFGQGLGLDNQNYPLSVDVNVATQPTKITSDIVWSMPQFLIGGTYDTPDISPIIQAQVSANWYNQDSGVLVTNNTISDTAQNRIWRSPGDATGPAPQLFVNYTPPTGLSSRNIVVDVVDNIADINILD